MINFRASRIEIANSEGRILSTIRDSGPGDANRAAGSISIRHTPGDSRWVRAYSASGAFTDHLVDDDLRLPVATRKARSSRQQTVTIHAHRGLQRGGTVVFRDDEGKVIRRVTDGAGPTTGSLVRDENAALGVVRTSLPVGWRGTVEILNVGQQPIFYSLNSGRLGSINLPPVIKLQPPSYYIDPTRSVIDPKIYDEYRKQIDPLLDALAFFNSGASAIGTPAQRLARARRVIAVLARWADAQALTGPRSEVDFKLRMWALSGIANAYTRITKIPGAVTRATDAKIKGWIRSLANVVRSEFNPKPGQFLNHANIGAWFGASMAAVGRLLGDESFGAVADEVLRRQISDIARATPGKPAGFLPEVSRGGKALFYTNFGLEALLTIMQIRGKPDAWNWSGGALRTAAQKAIDGIADPSEFARLTKRPQDPWDVQKLYWLHMLPQDLKNRAASLRKNGRPVVEFDKISPFGRFQGGDVRTL